MFVLKVVINRTDTDNHDDSEDDGYELQEGVNEGSLEYSSDENDDSSCH